MSGTLTPNDIPNFITANTPMALRKAMLLNSARMASFVTYRDISQVTINGKLVWIAWFSEPISDNKAISDLSEVE